MPRALILGGTGVLGSAIARRLIGSGWRVDVTGREPSRMPTELAVAGVRFHSSDRHDPAALAQLVGAGTDLLVDGLCFTAADARQLLPVLADSGSAVMLSSKAVYVDADGRHVNSDEPPSFDGPITEQQPTMTPSDVDHRSREGYGANKVAAEQVLLDSGHPITVLRASKVHGVGASRPREWMFVNRVLDRRPVLFLARRGAGADHPTAAVNAAALVENVATQPGARILNCADPDVPTGLDIARIVAGRLNHRWQEVLLADEQTEGVTEARDGAAGNGAVGDGAVGGGAAGHGAAAASGSGPELGAHPWDSIPPIVLDTSAAVALGYRPVGTYADTVVDEIDWLVAEAAAGRTARFDDPFFAQFIDYALEDRALATCRLTAG